jgi:hypothetical protein
MRSRLLALLEPSPEFPAAWEALAWQVGRRGRMRSSESVWLLEKIDYGLSFSPDPQTRGYLLISKAVVMMGVGPGRRDEAIAILGELALDPTAPRDVEATAKEALVWVLRQ